MWIWCAAGELLRSIRKRLFATHLAFDSAPSGKPGVLGTLLSPPILGLFLAAAIDKGGILDPAPRYIDQLTYTNSRLRLEALPSLPVRVIG